MTFKYDWGMENIETLCEVLNPIDIVEVEMPVGYVPPGGLVKIRDCEMMKVKQDPGFSVLSVSDVPGLVGLESEALVVWVVELKGFLEWIRSVESLTQALVDL